MRNIYKTILLILTGVNVIISIHNHNFSATLAWGLLAFIYSTEEK